MLPREKQRCLTLLFAVIIFRNCIKNMASQTSPLSTNEMVAYLEGHPSRWEKFQKITDKLFRDTDYGYDVTVLDKDDTFVEIYNACTRSTDHSSDNEDTTEIENLICEAIRDGNILICSSSHVQNLEENAFDMKSCELSTQSIFYYITCKSGWHVTAMGGLVGPLSTYNSCSGHNPSFDHHFCLVRDPSDTGLKQLNDKAGFLLGPSLPAVFEWDEEEAESMESLIHLFQGITRIHDELDSLMNQMRTVRDELERDN